MFVDDGDGYQKCPQCGNMTEALYRNKPKGERAEFVCVHCLPQSMKPANESWLILFKADGGESFQVTPFESHEKAVGYYDELAAAWSDVWLCKVEKKNHVD